MHVQSTNVELLHTNFFGLTILSMYSQIDNGLSVRFLLISLIKCIFTNMISDIQFFCP